MKIMGGASQLWNWTRKSEITLNRINRIICFCKFELFQCKTEQFRTKMTHSTIHCVSTVSSCSAANLKLRQLRLCVSMSASGLWCNWMGPTATDREKIFANVAFCNAEIVFYHNDPIGLLRFYCTRSTRIYKRVNEFASIQFSVTLFLCARLLVSVESWIKNKMNGIALKELVNHSLFRTAVHKSCDVTALHLFEFSTMICLIASIRRCGGKIQRSTPSHCNYLIMFVNLSCAICDSPPTYIFSNLLWCAHFTTLNYLSLAPRSGNFIIAYSTEQNPMEATISVYSNNSSL